MLSEADLIAKRATLRWLAMRHPEWTQQELAETLGMSRSWVSKWLGRLHQADPADVLALHSRSRARHTPPVSIASQFPVVQRILEIRAAPPEHLQRVPGPEAILYYLHRDPELKLAGVRLPRSQTTIWKILRQAGCIEQDRRRRTRPLEPRQPGEEVQFDLKDASSVPADPEGKQQHVVEIANFVDAGTSIWLHHEVGDQFDAEALFEVIVQFLRQHGLPGMLTFDNDPRLVGGPSGRDFPSALVRFLWCVGVTQSADPATTPRPQCVRGTISSFAWLRVLADPSAYHAGAGRRVHRGVFLSLQPGTARVLARSCGNQPPRVACSAFPALPAVPEAVDPDRWLAQVDKRAFARTIRSNGSLTIDQQDYSVSRTLAGQRVTCRVNAAERCLEIWLAGTPLKSLPIKGLQGKPLPFQEYVEVMKQEARSAYRQYLRTHSKLAQGRLWA